MRETAQSRERRSRWSSPPRILAHQACKRCHTRKRKCDKRQPRCANCEEANVPCEVDLRPSERDLAQQLAECHERVLASQERVSWLEALIRAHVPVLAHVHDVATGSVTAQIPLTPTMTTSSAPQPIPPGGPSQVTLPQLAISNLVLRSFSADPISQQPPTTSPAIHSELPSMTETMDLAFDHLAEFKQSHHFTDKFELEDDIRKVYGPNGFTSSEFSASRFRCFAIAYAGLLNKEGHVTSEKRKACRAVLLKELKNVLAKEDIVAIQALACLAIVSINEPGGPNFFQVAGLAVRTAIAIRLHRRDEVYLSSLPTFPNIADMHKHNQLRKNLFWAVYSLDRLCMHVLGHPPSIRDSDIDVDFFDVPSPSPGTIAVPSAALRVHNLKQRKLYGRIQDHFYAPSVKPSANGADDTRLVAAYLLEIQDWYQSNPLKTSFVPISAATIARQSLDDISYHQMILAVHRPSPLIPDISSAFVWTLLDSAGISVDLYRHYWKIKQILINWIHLYQIFTSCITLVYCFCECRNRSDLVAVPLETVKTRTAQCRELLLEFGPRWPESPHYQLMFDTLVSSFDANSVVAPAPLPAEAEPAVQEGGSSLAADTAIADFLQSLTEDGSPLLGHTTSPNEIMRSFWSAQA